MFPECSGVVDCWGRLLKSELIGTTVDLFRLMEKSEIDENLFVSTVVLYKDVCAFLWKSNTSSA